MFSQNDTPQVLEDAAMELIALMDAFWQTEQGQSAAPIDTTAIAGKEAIRKKGLIKPVRRKQKSQLQWFRLTSKGVVAAKNAIAAYNRFLKWDGQTKEAAASHE